MKIICFIFMVSTNILFSFTSPVLSQIPQPTITPIMKSETSLDQYNSRENNSWYSCSASDTVFIFVHGIFSDSKACWTAKNGTYWPELLKSDSRFNDPGIFLGGYYTDFTSGLYKISNAANELQIAIESTDPNGNPAPLKKHKIIFVAHSTGGLVVRYLIERHADLFKDKLVGLVLLASPSKGSSWANRLSFIRKFFKNKMADQLTRSNDFLEEFNSRWDDLMAESKLPNLIGFDLFENKFIVRWFFLFKNAQLVSSSESDSIFGSPKIVPDSDHFSIAKPTSITDPSHSFLWYFYEQRYLPKANMFISNNVYDSDFKIDRFEISISNCVYYEWDKLPEQSKAYARKTQFDDSQYRQFGYFESMIDHFGSHPKRGFQAALMVIHYAVSKMDLPSDIKDKFTNYLVNNPDSIEELKEFIYSMVPSQRYVPDMHSPNRYVIFFPDESEERKWFLRAFDELLESPEPCNFTIWDHTFQQSTIDAHILEWHAFYNLQFYPVFEVYIKNMGNNNIIIDKLDAEVIQIGEYLGGAEFVPSSKIYSISVSYEVGHNIIELSGDNQIYLKKDEIVRIIIRLEPNGIFSSYLMQLHILSGTQKCSTPVFAVDM